MNLIFNEHKCLIVIMVAMYFIVLSGCGNNTNDNMGTVAETGDGTRVLLHENGTWEYLDGDSGEVEIHSDTSLASMAEKQVQLEAEVLEVIDGDTYRIRVINPSYGIQELETIRLLGVNAPEINPLEYYAVQAKEYIEEQILGKRIRISFDRVSRDAFCRLLAYVYLEDGSSLNLDMIEKGYAKLFPRYNHRLYDELLAAQESAMSNIQGLWDSDSNGAQIIYIYNRGRKEYIALANRSNRAIDISNWSIADKMGTQFIFPDGTSIRPRQIIKVFSGELGKPILDEYFYIGSAMIWNNQGDEAFLLNKDSHILNKYKY